MQDPSYLILADRGVIGVGGADAVDFLQGLVSNDVAKVSPAKAIWSAMLTPQGKFLHEFFIAEHNGRLLLDCEAARRQDLKKKLSMYKLRAKVEITDEAEKFSVAGLFGNGALDAVGLSGAEGAANAFADGVVFTEPRLSEMGARAILPADTAAETLGRAGLRPAARADYDAIRLTLGLPDGSRDMVVEKAILLENGFDELHGVDWDKGCYMGQELTSRTRYRGLVKKRLMPVTIDGAPPQPGTPLMAGDREAGEMRSSSYDRGLALVRLKHLDDGGVPPLKAGAATVTPELPGWMRLPENR
ncbi:MAG TPA: folate-binding protein [Alphaproteobacteria bacterium]|nr:folate-binding protein [Alphaproteobacteria bacterium]